MFGKRKERGRAGAEGRVKETARAPARRQVGRARPGAGAGAGPQAGRSARPCPPGPPASQVLRRRRRWAGPRGPRRLGRKSCPARPPGSPRRRSCANRKPGWGGRGPPTGRPAGAAGNGCGRFPWTPGPPPVLPEPCPRESRQRPGHSDRAMDGGRRPCPGLRPAGRRWALPPGGRDRSRVLRPPGPAVTLLPSACQRGLCTGCSRCPGHGGP